MSILLLQPDKLRRLGHLLFALVYLILTSCNSTPPATYIVQDGKVKVFTTTFIDHYEDLTIAEVESFQILNNTYAKDSRNVYVGFNTVNGADVASFEALSSNIGRDSSQFYYYSSPLGVNLEGRSIVDFNKYFWSDGYGVYYKLERVADLEPIHRVVSETVLENGSHVFYKNKLLAGLQVGRYKIYDHDYLLGEDAIYYQDIHIPVDIPKKFRLLQDYGSGKFFTDGVHVFSNWTRLKSADPDTFVCLDHGFAKDREHVFSGHFIIKNADPESFTMVFGKAYGKDKNGIVTDNDRENVENDAM